MAVEIWLNQKTTLVVSIYAASGAKELFFKELTQEFDEVIHDNIMMAGDFNGTIDNNLVRKDAKINRKDGKLPKIFLSL